MYEIQNQKYWLKISIHNNRGKISIFDSMYLSFYMGSGVSITHHVGSTVGFRQTDISDVRKEIQYHRGTEV